MSSDQKAMLDKLKEYGSFAWRQLALPFFMVIVGIVIFQPVERWWTGEDKYIIYLVGNKNDAETQRIFRSIQQEAALAKPSFDGGRSMSKKKMTKANLNWPRQKRTKSSRTRELCSWLGMSQVTLQCRPCPSIC